MEPYITNLFIKSKKNEQMIEMSSIDVEKNFGILGCINSKKGSPRQILINDKQTLEDFSLLPGMLRENIVIHNLQNLNSGDEIIISKEVRLRITFKCEVCKYLKQLKIKDPSKIMGKRGYLCSVLNSGSIKIGDTICVNKMKYEVIPEKYIDRLRWVINKIPIGKVITYMDLLTLVGGSNAYLRTFPYYLKQSKDKNLPIHRVVTSSGFLLNFINNQSTLLKNEGIEVENDAVNIFINRWNYENLYSV